MAVSRPSSSSVMSEGRVGTITLNRPKALNALNTQVMNEVDHRGKGIRCDPGIGCDRHHRQRERRSRPVRTSRRCADCRSRTCSATDFFASGTELAAVRTPTDRRGRRLCPRRRLRTGDDVRRAHRRRHRQVRPAGDQTRRHARHGRQPATHPGDRQGQGHGPDPDRPHHGRRGGRTRRTGVAGACPPPTY